MAIDDSFKGLVHYATGSLAAAMLLYNVGAWMTRRERRLALNSLVYLMLVGFEGYQTYHHLTRRDA